MTHDGAPVRAGSLDRVRLAVATGPLAGPVVSRVIGIAASRSELPVDRLNDALLIADALVAHATPLVPDGRLELAARTGDGSLELRVGPLRDGGGAKLLEDSALPGVGNVIARLASTTRVAKGSAGGEVLVILVESRA